MQDRECGVLIGHPPPRPTTSASRQKRLVPGRKEFRYERQTLAKHSHDQMECFEFWVDGVAMGFECRKLLQSRGCAGYPPPYRVRGGMRRVTEDGNPEFSDMPLKRARGDFFAFKYSHDLFSPSLTSK